MAPEEDPTADLLDRAGRGDDAAREELLTRHRARLKRMVAVRMDRRLARRCDPSDVVQQTLIDAFQKLPEYLRNPELPFYPWLRQLAWKRLHRLYEKHIHTQKCSVLREEPRDFLLSDESALRLSDCVVASGSSPSRQVLRAELRDRVHSALARLEPRDREVLVMRDLEQMSTREIAAVLQDSEDAVKKRRTRALVQLEALLAGESGEREGRP
jgi:RNA polymerase sigma-70 factor, ECF subfamily